MGLTPRPLFYAYPGRISNNPHESMEPRCVLPSMRTISAPADCTRPLLGSGRNRYVRILPSGTAERSLFRIVRQKLLYVTYPKLSGPFVEVHKAIFWVGGWDPYSLPLFSNRSSKTIICSFSRGSTERCPAVQSGAAELAACARAFGMRALYNLVLPSCSLWKRAACLRGIYGAGGFSGLLRGRFPR